MFKAAKSHAKQEKYLNLHLFVVVLPKISNISLSKDLKCRSNAIKIATSFRFKELTF